MSILFNNEPFRNFFSGFNASLQESFKINRLEHYNHNVWTVKTADKTNKPW